MQPICLAIDTTFDDTSVAILKGHNDILANLTLSQFKDHEAFGGVVPERASRKHLEVIHHLISESLKQSGLTFQEIDYFAVSHYPGLLGSLLVGVTVAKSLAYSLDKPIIGINHVESHPYACFLSGAELTFPCLHLVVAGGHTLLMHARNHFDYQIVGRSLDDAAGECVDKVAKMFGHPMPGGPVVDGYAMQFSGEDFEFPKPLLKQKGFDFSFSGLKTAMLRFRQQNPDILDQEGPILAAFFKSVCEVLVEKTFSAAESLGLNRISVSGGLAASRKLKEVFTSESLQRGIDLHYPSPGLCTDNAAMVACLASFRFEAGLKDDLNLEAYPNLI